MSFELELNKANRLKLSRVFRNHKRVDFSIECAIEGQMGKAFVDDLTHPSSYRITVGPFWYFAGDAHSPGAYQMMKEFPRYNLLMPSPSDWIDLAKEVYGQHLQPFTRYTFSASSLSTEHLTACLKDSGYQSRVIPIDVKIATQLASQPESYLELSDFDSVQDFIERGIGYVILDEQKVMGIAYSSLVCSTGIEVSVFVDEPYRQKGVATALSGKLLLECLKLNLRPNWDAANPESCKLAKRLGFSFVETYDSYYHTVQ
jgi:GNAT superfamily N-acetyltransferase